MTVETVITARTDELPGGTAFVAAWHEAETIAATNPRDKWNRARPDERERYVRDAAITRRRALEQVQRAGYASITDYLEAGDESPDAPIPLRDFLALELDPPSWLVDDLIPKGPAVGGLFGAEKAGKSLAGLQLCFAVAAGDDFLGFPIDNRGPTLFIEYEGSKAALQRRVATMAAKYGALQPTIPVGLSIVHRPPFRIDTDAGEAWLTRYCNGRVLCIVGPIAKATTFARENDPGEWQHLAQRLQNVTDKTGCTVMVVHHTRKPDRVFGAPSKVADFMNSARGSNSFMGAVDVAIGVQRDPESDEGVLYHLLREGASGRTAYKLDIASLCIYADGRALKRASADDRVQMVRDYIALNPGCTKAKMSADLRVLDGTLDGYLKSLRPELVIRTDGEHGANTYRLTA